MPSGESIVTCKDYKYLGSSLMSPDVVLADRRALAWRAAHLLRAIFHSSARETLKVRLFQSAVESILFYGLEAVPFTHSREGTLDASHRALLRFALGIHFPQRISSGQLMAKAGLPLASDSLRRRRQKLLGHCLRSHARGELNPLALTLLHPPTERLRRGHGRTLTLPSTFLSDLRSLDLTPLSTTTCPSDL